MGEHKTSARCAEAGGNVERAKTLACRRSRPQLTSSALQQGGRHGCCSFPLAASLPARSAGLVDGRARAELWGKMQLIDDGACVWERAKRRDTEEGPKKNVHARKGLLNHCKRERERPAPDLTSVSCPRAPARARLFCPSQDRDATLKASPLPSLQASTLFSFFCSTTMYMGEKIPSSPPSMKVPSTL